MEEKKDQTSGLGAGAASDQADGGGNNGSGPAPDAPPSSDESKTIGDAPVSETPVSGEQQQD